VSPQGRARSARSTEGALQAFLAFLRARGQSVTRSRRLVAETLLRAPKHVAADDLVETLRRSGTPVASATVYRTLALMRASGHFDAHDFGRGKRLYEPTLGRPHHDHLCCISCGAVIEFSEEGIEKLQEEVVKRHHFRPVYHSHKIFGYCARCPAGGGRRRRMHRA
jgi:Fur family transcriptional regulator, ferric uptake regulator